jgi:hypothetical protein
MNLYECVDFTPSYCRDALLSLHQKWLRMAGAEIVDEAGNNKRPIMIFGIRIRKFLLFALFSKSRNISRFRTDLDIHETNTFRKRLEWTQLFFPGNDKFCEEKLTKTVPVQYIQYKGRADVN